MRVLVACEFSGIVREAFRARGHDAWSCDLLPTEIPGTHFQGDVLKIIDDGWDLMIAHPPCTYLSYAAMHVWNNPERVYKRLEALKFFADLWEASIEKICIENPRGCASPTIAKYTQIIQPYYFGDRHLKTTWLWLKNLPPLQWADENELFQNKTAVNKPEPISTGKITHGKKRYFESSCNGFKGNQNRRHERSRFWPGVAKAMAEQWG